MPSRGAKQAEIPRCISVWAISVTSLLAGGGTRIVSMCTNALRVHCVLTGQLLHSIAVENNCHALMPVPETALIVGQRDGDDACKLHLYDIETGVK
jgi:hypothetical protein